MTKFERDDTVPMSREEMRRLKRREPSAKVPAELAALDKPALPRKTVKFLDRAAARVGRIPSVVQAYVPPWVGFSYTPKSAPRPRPPAVTHRGQPVNPLVAHPPENRSTYSDHSYPWVCVCLITRPDGGRGSGVLIGPRHVLTASHIVQWNTDVAERIDVHVAGGSSLATAHTDSVWAFTQISGDPDSTTIDDDYAVIVLDQRLGDRFGYFGTKEYNSDWDDDPVWSMIGYSRAVGEYTFPVQQHRFSMDEDEIDLGEGRAIRTSADTSPGQSGSPVFGMWAGDTGAYAVAVVSAEQGDVNWCGGGSGLDRIVAHARSQDP